MFPVYIFYLPSSIKSEEDVDKNSEKTKKPPKEKKKNKKGGKNMFDFPPPKKHKPLNLSIGQKLVIVIGLLFCLGFVFAFFLI